MRPVIIAANWKMHTTPTDAAELATTGVTANAICPAYVDTPMTDGAVETIVTGPVLSQAFGRPVRMQWSREEGTAWDPKAPAGWAG